MRRAILTILTGLLVGACGGKAERDPEPPGPLREGAGLYDLRIETLSDDCDPPLLHGNFDSALVVVRGRNVNIPVYQHSNDGGFAPSRAEVPLDEPYVFEHAPYLPPCQEVTLRYEWLPRRADGQQIDLESVWSIRGVDATCSEEPSIANCTSRRIFRFRWLHECGSSDACP